MRSRSVLIEAPAKINLRLCVLARESSGFHQIETIFCAISLADRLSVEPADGLYLHVEGAGTGSVTDNLVFRAAERFYAAWGHPPGARITLQKFIPVAAGLGGGSTDAAATLLALNRLHGHPFDRAALLTLGAELGSDVPFFLGGSPWALAWGRGERLLALPPLPRRPLVIAWPGRGTATVDAYRELDRVRGKHWPSVPLVLGPAQLDRWPALEALATNDFEPWALEAIPELQHIRARLQELGARVARLTGTGSAMFGLFDTSDAATTAVDVLAGEGWAAWAVHTLESLPAPVEMGRVGHP